MKVTEHAPGNFCWAELITADGVAAKAFYSGLFGWRHEDNPISPDDVYTMYYKGDGVVCASYEEKSMPPHWGAYISSTNIDDTVSAAKSAGATVMMEPMDVMTAGRMAVLQDPTGAFINVWQPKEHIGATVTGEPNTVGWNELNTRDTEAAKTFYTTVFGWTPKDSKVGHGYVEFENKGEMVAGMMGMTPEMAEVPPHWLTYFIVESADAAAEKAKSLGGQVLYGPEDIPNTGRFAVIKDPIGAAFGLFSM